MQLLASPNEVIKHVLSFLSSGRKYTLYYTAKAFRKHLKPTRLTHKIQGAAIGIFTKVAYSIVLDSPLVRGFTRYWQGLSDYERTQFKSWILGNTQYTYNNRDRASVCLLEQGLCYVSYEREIRVLELHAPIPYVSLGLQGFWSRF